MFCTHIGCLDQREWCLYSRLTKRYKRPTFFCSK